MKKISAVMILVSLMLVGLLIGPTAQEVRRGAWVDKVVFFEEPDQTKAYDMIETGEMDLYGLGIANPDLYQRMQQNDEVTWEESFGSFNEILLNPAGAEACDTGGPFFNDGSFNPFAIRSVREAMQYLIDRSYITEEILRGLGLPNWFILLRTFPPYASISARARALELKYSHSKEKARELIKKGMEEAGAELINGKWQYEGEPVKVSFIIRVEDERLEIGHYFATLLEEMGFTVERQEKTSSEAAPIWLLGDPCEGQWNLYTGGWISNAIDREQATDFDFMYTPRGWPVPLNQGFTPSEELDEISDRLRRRDYETMEERQELLARGIELQMEEGWRVWTHVRRSTWPHPTDVDVTADLAAGVSGSYLWPYLLRKVDEQGNTVPGGTIQFGTPSIMTQPWNPIAGSNWLYDQMIIRATGDHPCKPDPFTGLTWPNRIKGAEVFVKEGLPVTKTLDWVDLEFVPEIEVPEDAWIDWDPEAQEFITVGEKHPEGLTSKTKVVIHYDDDLFENKWHDGSNLSLGDMVLSFILTFDRGKEKSAIYDEAYVPTYESFIKNFRGARIVQEDPVIIEVYSDQFALDAEILACNRAGNDTAYFWPSYDQGIGAWHTLAVGILAEKANQLAFSEDKADKLGVDRMNFIAGPSLNILKDHSIKAISEGYIPYEPTLGQFIDKEEALSRYANLENWLKDKGHFWVGLGPLQLESVDTTAKIAVAERFTEYKDPATKWMRFTEAKVADAEISGPDEVKVGAMAEFEVEVTFQGEPYPTDELEFVKFLVIDANGKISITGNAEAAEDGLWNITFDTSDLPVGSTQLEVVVKSRKVAMPSTAAFTFVTR